MGAYRYCPHCDNWQDRITVEEIADTYGHDKVTCGHCGYPRSDDTDDERTSVLAAAIVELKERLK